MSRGKKTGIVCVSILAIVFIASVIVSVDKFSTLNPFKAISGLFQITYTPEEYVEIQKAPKVIIAKSDSASYEKLTQFMNSRGYVFSENEQAGAMNVFRNEKTEDVEYVFFSINKYYSLWVWKD